MKIGQEMRSRVEQKTFSKQPEGKKNFNKLVQSQFHKMKREELDQLMQDITKQGEQIARFRSFRDLATYKRMIIQFLEKTEYRGFELSEFHHFSPRSSSNKLIQDITKKKEKIAIFHSFRDITNFKRMNKQYLEKTVYSGFKLTEPHHFSPSSPNHTIKTVKKIDEKLIQLTDDLMEQEKTTVDLLGVIGEINGLLINIYT